MNAKKFIFICAISLFSFCYGTMPIQYKIIPFEQLKAVKWLLIPAPAIAQPQTPTPVYSDYFYHKVSFFEQHGGHDYDVVFIGDSLTDCAEWEDLFPSLKIANRGIGGDRTDCVLKRLDNIYSTNAKKAFIMIGTNDFIEGYEVDNVLENYKKIINNLLAHGIQPYVQSTPLVGSRRAQLNTKIIALNEQLKQIASQNKAITWIDLNVGLAKGAVLNPEYSRDAVHLNGDGYAIWKNIIKKYLQ